MKTRPFHPQFWEDDYILNLLPLEKLLFNFYITTDKRGLTPYYEISSVIVKTCTGLKDDFIEKTKEKFQKDGKFIFYKNWIYIVNGTKYEKYFGEKLLSAVEHELSTIPDTFKDFVAVTIKQIGYLYPIDRVSETQDTPNNNNSNNNNTNTKGKIENSCKEYLEHFNFIWGTSQTNTSLLIKPLAFWLKTYTLEQIKQAISNSFTDPFYKDAHTPVLYLRTRNKNGDCDYIGQLLNKPVKSSNLRKSVTVTDLESEENESR